MIPDRYAAFISYRHQSPDQEIARKLHRMIETYVVPAALRRDGSRHPGKVFRDQEELPLSPDLGRDIEMALDQSEWLICVCSPRYLESRWCLREVEYFIARKGRDRVLAVLAEGEPEDSFPELLRFDTDAAGNRLEREPLAANVRGDTLSESLKRLKKEKFRILAPMVGTSFDGLYQRHRRRTLRNVLTAALAAIAILGGFLAYALAQNAQITRQNRQITAQNEQITEQNAQITEQNIRIEEERQTASRNECDLLVEKSVYYSSVNRKQEAADLALDALAVSETVEGYDDAGVWNALAVSCFMGDFAVEAELDFPGMVSHDPACSFSPDGSRIAVTDSRSALTLCDANTGARLWVAAPFSHDITSVQWSADGARLVVTAQWGHVACVIDAATGERLHEVQLPWACNAVFDGDDVLVAFAQGIVRWTPGGDDDTLPFVVQIPENQHADSRTLLDGRCIALCEHFASPQRIFVKPLDDEGCYVVALEDAAMVLGYALSPGGDWLYVHQYGSHMIVNLATDEVRWKVASQEDGGGNSCTPVWAGDVILDCGTAYDAMSGDSLYTYDSDCVAASPDGEYAVCREGILRLSDGSLYASAPGQIRAMDESGEHLVVYTSGASDSASTREQRAYKEWFPGNGSQYGIDAYEGSLLDIPDWSPPAAENGEMLVLNDPYAADTTGIYAPQAYFSPDGRYNLQTNRGMYIPIYDLERGNEPIARIYDFSVGDHVEAADVSFSADSRYAAIAGVAGNVAVYELETGRMVNSYTDLYGVRALSELKFNRSGSCLMAADFNRSSFRVYSVTNGQTLYAIHAKREVDAWGFDEATGDAVVRYSDGSALVARMFEDREALLDYARQRAEQASTP